MRRCVHQNCGAELTAAEQRDPRRLACTPCRDRVAASCTALAHKLALDFYARVPYARRYGAAEDVQSVALWGLYFHAGRYDPRKGLKATTYLTWCLSGHLKAYCKKGHLIGLPANYVEGPDWDRAVSCERLSDGPRGAHATDLPDPRHDDAHDRAARNDVAALVRQALRGLRPQDAAVLRMRFGIGCERATAREVAEKLGCTKQNVQQIQARVLRQLHRERLGNGLLRLAKEAV